MFRAGAGAAAAAAGERVRVRRRGRRVRRVRGAAGGACSARRHAGLPATRGAAQGASADDGRGRVGRGRGAGVGAVRALPLLPRALRLRGACRAGRPAGHEAAAARRARAR